MKGKNWIRLVFFDVFYKSKHFSPSTKTQFRNHRKLKFSKQTTFFDEKKNVLENIRVGPFVYYFSKSIQWFWYSTSICTHYLSRNHITIRAYDTQPPRLLPIIIIIISITILYSYLCNTHRNIIIADFCQTRNPIQFYTIDSIAFWDVKKKISNVEIVSYNREPSIVTLK